MSGAGGEDFVSDLETSITILEDLLSIAIEEIGNGTKRALSVLLPALIYVRDIKSINRRWQQAQSNE